MLTLMLAVLPKKYRSKIEQLYNDYKNIMLHTAYNIVKDVSLAEDIVHSAFIRIIKHVEKINGFTRTETKGYIVYIVKNLSIDYIRKRNRNQTVSYDKIDYRIQDNGQQTETKTMINLELSMVEDKLKEMDQLYATPLILKYTMGLTHAEIADMLHISLENSKVRCLRGRKMLVDAVKGVSRYE